MKIKLKAFTLAEIMIVLTIIAIITAILLPAAKNATPDESLMKFKKTNMSLASAIQELVNSDKYYSNGDLGLKPNGSLVDDPKYFCNTLADVLSVKSLNCSDKNTGYNSSAVANFPDILTNEIDGEKIYEYSDCMCNTQSLIPDEAEIVLSDDTSIYTINPYYHFGSKTETGSTEEKRLFNLCSKEKRYKFICLDIDGLNQGEPPFGYAIRADGKIVYGAKASAWIKASLQKKDDTEISFAIASSCSPSGLSITPENDICTRETSPSIPSPLPTPEPDPTCVPGEHCTNCDNATGVCTTCEDGYELADGQCAEIPSNSGPPRNQTDCDKYNSLFVTAAQNGTNGVNTCVTKYNAGDTYGPTLSADVSVKQKCQNTAKCCNRCTNCSNNICSRNGWGSSSYSGCNRTTCTFQAAVATCSAWAPDSVTAGQWRLPTKNEITGWRNNMSTLNNSKGSAGLQFCSYDADSVMASCEYAFDELEYYHYYPFDIWTSTKNGNQIYYGQILDSSTLTIDLETEQGYDDDPSTSGYWAFTTRCVTEIVSYD